MLTKVVKIVIGVVVVVVLALVAVLIWYFTQKHDPDPPPPITTYKCEQNACRKCLDHETDCRMTSCDDEKDCHAQAAPFKCQADTHQCVQCKPEDQCPKLSQDDCIKQCQVAPTGPWSCISGTCALDPKGKYATQDACRQAGCKPLTTCNLKTQDSLVITPSSVAQTMTRDDINKVLSQKDEQGNPLVYGQDMVVQCSLVAADPSDGWSKQFCQGKQLQVCQLTDACDGDATKCGKCQPFFSATGSTLTLDLDAKTKTLTSRAKRKFSNMTDASCPTTYYRGVCLPDDPARRYQAATRPYGLAFYHGGKTGFPETNANCAAKYLAQIAAFVKEKNINRVFLSVDAPLPQNKQNSYFLQPQFIAQHFLNNLPATSTINGKAQPMEAGIIAYANPIDSSWNFQFDQTSTNPFMKTAQATCQDAWTKDPSLYAIHDMSQCFSNTYFKDLVGGNIDPKTNDIVGVDPSTNQCPAYDAGFSTLGSDTPCAQNCETSTCADRLATIPCTQDADCQDYVGKNCMPYATQGSPTCDASTKMCKLDDCNAGTNCDTCAQNALCCVSKSNCHCPNIASQVVAYVTAVNDAVDALIKEGKVSASCPKLSYIAYDGEDAKADKDAGGQCQFSAMVNQLTNNSINVQRLGGNSNPNVPTKLGWAFSMGAQPFDQVNLQPNTSSFVMPEMYWYMGVNWPCVGSAQEYTQMDDLDNAVAPCTSQIAYRDAFTSTATTKGKLSPKQFYLWMTKIQPCVTMITSGDQFKAMYKNMKQFKGQVWPMYSSESLSTQQTDAPAATWCLARAFNAGGETQGKICGTADMLYTWSWDQIMELYDTTYQDLYLNAFDNYDAKLADGTYTPYLALYEAQFINPQWLDAKAFDSTFLSACQGNCEDKVVACKADADCQAFLKANPSLCKDYTAYCNTNKTCHFAPPTPPATCTSDTCFCQYCQNGKPVPCQNKPCADKSNCAPLACTNPTCNAHTGQAECASALDASGPYCGSVCKGDCACKYAVGGKCKTCTKDTDCPSNSCVQKKDSKCV